MSDRESIPWVEKYRPTCFDDIVLDDMNRTILTNIVETNTFPNLLLYGPPGTGKTTTVVNLVQAYQERYQQKSKGLMIHLNASDERGIDVIRTQIAQFVNSKSLFIRGLKIVILDEVDYMTKNAQQALKYLLQEFSDNVRFCLICNYSSRIDDSLQNELMHLRFNQLPTDRIIEFLTTIRDKEGLSLLDDSICAIQKMFGSDIRSMINYMQSHISTDIDVGVAGDSVWETLLEKIISENSHSELIMISEKYGITAKNVIKDFLNYVISNHDKFVTSEFLRFAQSILHTDDSNQEYLVNYFLLRMRKLISSIS
jgi:DNA polymerase III delta prime subunit